MARRLRDLGALVAGIDIRSFMKDLESSGGCAYPAGSLEDLSRSVQLRYGLPAYKRPILVGYSSGATLVYAALAAAPAETFAGAVSLGFCPGMEIHVPLCEMRGLKAAKRTGSAGYDLSPFARLPVPWMVLQGEADQVCAPAVTRAFAGVIASARVFSLAKVGHGFGVPARWEPQFIEAYKTIAAGQVDRDPPRVTVPGVADLSLVEVTPPAGQSRDLLAIMLSGDGGWADLDKSVAAALARDGVPVVGWSSLEYYWTRRTPESAAADLAKVIDHYTAVWGKTRVLIAGYSFGADVAPFLVNRLPEADASRIERVALVGPSQLAAFEFHVANWLGSDGDARYPTAPEIARLRVPVTCISPADEPDSVCRAATGAHARRLSFGSGHHFGGDYARLAEMILQ
jgi:type IV secretory pathway VirJ component